MAIPDPASAKSALRALIRARIPAAIPGEASASIVDHLLSRLSDEHSAGPISLFAPRRDEPDLLSLCDRHPSTTWLFPRVDGSDISLHKVDDPARLAPGSFGILEPPADAPTVPASEVRVFICPGIAFDRSGLRLGRGGGYYDRLLSRRQSGSLVIGVCCEEQLVARVPADDHDVPMDLVITAKRIIESA